MNNQTDGAPHESKRLLWWGGGRWRGCGGRWKGGVGEQKLGEPAERRHVIGLGLERPAVQLLRLRRKRG